MIEMIGFKYITHNEDKVVKLVENNGKETIDTIKFTSPPSDRNLFKIAEVQYLKEPLQYHHNKNVIVVAVGPSTMKAIEENYVHVDVMPDVYKMGAMIKSLSDYLGQANAPKKKRKLT